MVRRFPAALSFLVCLLISPAAIAMTRTWSGAAGANWSNGANWSPAGTPVASDVLVFPAAAANQVMNNDLPAGTTMGPMTFQSNYTLNGSALSLSGDISLENGGVTWNVDAKLTASVSFWYLSTNGALDINGQTLTMHSGGGPVFNGPINGTGAIVILGPYVQIGSQTAPVSGNFSGTINGNITMYATMPNVTVTAAYVGGTGAIGDLTFKPFDPSGMYNSLAPGDNYTDHYIGTLQMKSLTINGSQGLVVDVKSGGGDQIKINGTVSLATLLSVGLLGAPPVAGETFRIIDNDGSDAINGTFTGVAEGATVSTWDGLYKFQVSYHGGDGNDVVLTTLPGAKTWTGAAGANWSNSANWSPAGAPTASDVLVFPAAAANQVMNNDLSAGTTLGSMTFRGQYTLNGNALSLGGDISLENGGVTWNVDAKLTASVTFRYLSTNGALDINGQTLTVDTNGGSAFNGPINGTGAIVIHGPNVQIGSRTGPVSSGNFNGTINGNITMYASMPNVTVTAAYVGGTGAIGDLTFKPFDPSGMYNSLAPGDNYADRYIGTLQMKSLTINGSEGVTVDVKSGGGDQIKINGTVSLATPLSVVLLGAPPVAGETFRIIDNDGSEAINGTFTGAAEGATITTWDGHYKFQVSYHGGDGNDVVLTTLPGDKTWTGAAGNQWSNPGNWSPQAAPVAGEKLVFPAGAANQVMNNDLPAGTTMGSMTFDGPYTLNGNTLSLSGDVSALNGGVAWNVDTKLTASVAFSLSSNVNGAFDINGHMLTINSGGFTFNGPINGSGAIVIHGPNVQIGSRTGPVSSGNFNGTINGNITMYASMPNVTVTAAYVGGTGAIGDLTFKPFDPSGMYNSLAPGDFYTDHFIGTLQMKSLTINGSQGVVIDVGPTSADRLQVVGTVSLSTPLGIVVSSLPPALGQTFLILDNDGTDAINGAFTNLPEGAVAADGGAFYGFRITYRGGDGNDVVLTAVDLTSTSLVQTAATTMFGEPVTLTATATAKSGPPAGSVTFRSGATDVSTATLQNGVAAVALSTLEVGSHDLAAEFRGSAMYAGSASAALPHTVTRGKTASVITSNRPNSLYGQRIQFAISVSVQAPAAGKPGGSVIILADGAAIGSALVVDGVATFETSSLPLGTTAVSAQYDGDAHFEKSSAAAVQQAVGKAPTAVDARPRHPLVAGASPLVTVFVNATTGPTVTPAGEVSISEGGVLLARQALVDGAARMSLPPLPAGEHALVVAYGGNAQFEPSSVTVTQTVSNAQLSVHGTRVAEGNSGSSIVSLLVSLSAPLPQPVRVSFATLGGSATEGVDYERAGGVIEFAPGELTRAVEVRVYGDITFEDDESFSILLSDPVNASIETASAVIVIANDDQLPARRRPARH